MKRCSKCGVEKPLSEFHADRQRPDGKRNDCKPCHTAVVRARQTVDAERISKRAAERYAANRERDLARNKQWRENNRDARAQYKKEYCAVNEADIREYHKARYYCARDDQLQKNREYRQNNPHVWAAKAARYRAARMQRNLQLLTLSENSMKRNRYHQEERRAA